MTDAQMNKLVEEATLLMAERLASPAGEVSVRDAIRAGFAVAIHMCCCGDFDDPEEIKDRFAQFVDHQVNAGTWPPVSEISVQ